MQLAFSPQLLSSPLDCLLQVVNLALAGLEKVWRNTTGDGSNDHSSDSFPSSSTEFARVERLEDVKGQIAEIIQELPQCCEQGSVENISRQLQGLLGSLQNEVQLVKEEADRLKKKVGKTGFIVAFSLKPW